jgi:RNA polymerase sigma-70 factor (ECF subfamily)
MGGLIYSIALGIMKDPERARDILHESYVKAFKTLNNLRDPLRLASWLHSMVTHLCYDVLRRDALEAQGSVEVMSRTPKVVPIDKVLIKEEELRCLECALSTLPEPFRVILSMKYMNRYSCQEIAGTLGLAVGTVKSRLFEARKLLMRRMAEVENARSTNLRGGLKP